MVAARNIKAGEIVLKEMPLTFGPSENTKPLCLSTFQPVTAKSVQNAMRVLNKHGLVEIHKGEIKGKKTQTFSSTRLGHHVLNMYPPSNEE